MKTFDLRFALILLLLPTALAASAQSNFYGGDFDERDATSSERNTSVSDSRVYDDFTLGTLSNVTGLYGNFLLSTNTSITGLRYEVRRGITNGNGGTLLASGSVGATVVNTGTQALGMSLFRITSVPVSFNLSAGSYFLSLAAIGNGTGRAFLATTSGANGIGGPLNDGNSYFDSPTLGYSFSTTADAFGESYDYSQGLVARPVPEPATLAALGLAALGLARRRRRA